LYKGEDVATYLVKYVKFKDDWEVDRYGNANLGTVFREPPYPFDYPMRRLTMEEMLAKFIDEVKRVTTRRGLMTSEVTRSKEINETRINKNKPLRFEQDMQEKLHDDGMENKSSSIPEKTTQPLVKPQQSSIPFPNRSLLTNISTLEEACTETTNEKCSTVLLNELPSKEKDPGSFTTLCQVLEKHKEAEDLAAYHLSRFKNPHMKVLTEREIADKFSDENLMVLKSMSNNDEPWYADFVKYIVGKVVPPNWTLCRKRKRFFSQVKTYFWEEPYAFKLCADNIMRRCVDGSKTLEILAHCYSGPTVAADYVSKWVEAQALPTNGVRVVVKFLRSLFARFGVPKALISDRGTHFCNSQLEKALQRYGVTHKLSTAYHPQSNGQTEVTNRAIKRILERSVGYNPKGWSEKLNDALWAFRTTYKTPTGCTPFRLVYGKACHLPVEIEHKAHWALKQCNLDLTLASKSRLMQLNELAELRDDAYENTRIYKERTKKWHDSRLRGDKDFKVGDQVLLYNSRLKMYPGKLKLKLSGPKIVKTKYYGGDIDKEDDEVIELENDTATHQVFGVAAGESNLKTLTKTKVLAGRQSECNFQFCIESVFPDCLYDVSKPHGYGVLTIWMLSSLYFQHSIYDVFVKRIQRIRHRYQYGVSWGMDTAYRLPVQF
ncbi:reverse transcriptase domain-containing protein, partial [Tanacetum coccineum]